MEGTLHETESTVRDYVRLIFRRRRIIVTTLVTVITAVYLGLQLKTPVYEASVKMLITTEKDVLSTARSSELVLTQSEIVKSSPVVERVVRILRLNERPLDYENKFASPLKAIFVDLKLRRLQNKVALLSEKARYEILFQRTVQQLKKNIKIVPVKDTDLFVISVSDFQADQAAAIANVLSRSYCVFALEQELAQVQQRYGAKHLSVIELKDTIEKMKSLLLNKSIAGIDEMATGNVRIIEQATVPIEPVGKSKAAVMALALCAAIAAALMLAWIFENIDSTVTSPVQIRSFLGLRFLGDVPKKKSVLGNCCVFISRLVSLVTAASVVLLFLRICLRLIGANPNNPLVASFVSSTDFLSAWLESALHHDTASTLDIASVIMLVVIVVGGTIGAKMIAGLGSVLNKRRILVKNTKKSTGYLLAYQNLAEQVYFQMKEDDSKTVMFTSTLKAEGTSTVLANIGIYLAQKGGHKVLLIDANLRHPSLHRLFKIGPTSGLRDILEEKATFADSVRSVLPNLDVLTAGHSLSLSISLLDSARMQELIKSAESQYDLVLIDCASLRSFKDGIALSAHVDSIILVISEGKSRREVIKASISSLEHKSDNFIGAILNNRTFAIPAIIYEHV